MPRILIVDDNESIHRDFLKVLDSEGSNKLRDVEMALFGDDDLDLGPENLPIKYEIDNAYQGEEAVAMVQKAAEELNPYAVVFMDVRMPPGIDGIKAAARIWRKLPDTEIVICSAHSDYSWSEMLAEIGATDKLQFLRKPFDMVTVQQLALSCTKKWELLQTTRKYIRRLEAENTEKEEEQEKLAKANQALEARIQERNDELNQAQTELKETLASLEQVKAQWIKAGSPELGGLIKHLSDEIKTAVNECLEDLSQLSEQTGRMCAVCETGHIKTDELEAMLERSRKIIDHALAHLKEVAERVKKLGT